jgi:hypothetical protein
MSRHLRITIICDITRSNLVEDSNLSEEDDASTLRVEKWMTLKLLHSGKKYIKIKIRIIS